MGPINNLINIFLFSDLDFYLAAVIVLGNILVLAILILFARTISKLLKQTAKQNVTRTILICSIYPVSYAIIVYGLTI